MESGDKKKIFIICIISCWLLVSCGFIRAEEEAKEIKEPAVSGQFYPSNPQQLSDLIAELLNKVESPDLGKADIKVLVVPHAGYIFSAPVAAHGYKLIKGKSFKTVVVIGLSHYYQFSGISIYPKGYFKTPLGEIPVDSDACKMLTTASSVFKFVPEAFEAEHSLEVQLPFLQNVIGDFKLVPLLTGSPISLDTCKEAADALYSIFKDRDDVLLVVSTDLSHYHTQKTANKMDSKTISYIENLNVDELYQNSLNRDVELCGLSGMAIGIYYAKDLNAGKVKVLKYATSQDTQPDIRNANGVVGYVSAVFYKDRIEKNESKQVVDEEVLPMLNPIQRKRLLNIARDSIETYLKKHKTFEIRDDDLILNKSMGAFVTLHENGELRGCIGNIVGAQPLYLTVRDMAIASATEDPRFPKVTEDELKNIKIEISVLSEPQKIDNPDLIKMGKHGVIVRSGFKSGVFLPQVATETGWDRDTFMANLCSGKAGLPADAWKKKGTDIFIFTAEVFSEEQN